MKLLLFLLRASGSMTLLMVAGGVVSGACNAGLIALINTTLHEPRPSLRTLALIFAGIAVGKIGSYAGTQILMSRFAQRAVADFRRKLIRKVLVVPLRHLEEIGIPRILASLTDDVQTISNALVSLPSVVVNMAILLGGAVYLWWLSPVVFSVMLLFILVGIGCYRLLVTRGYGYVRLAREQADSLFAHLRALTEGIKELKLHRGRREAFLAEKIHATTEALHDYTFQSTRQFVLGQTWSQVFLFVAIGWILFGMPQIRDMSAAALTGYLVSFVYLMAPLNGLLNLLPMLGRAEVALHKVGQLGVSLDALAAEPAAGAPTGKTTSWQQLQLKGVTHSYHREKDDNHFILGPIDLTFVPGELVFLIGGNGTGKSTLAKVLTGLYPPETGAIYLDDTRIDDQNRDAYRQNFSVVFSDFYLFESLLGLTEAGTDARADTYLARLHLENKVKVKEGVLSTTALSQGQRKRLALLTAFLEDRPFYVFDEWAADQDPVFKEVFYLQILLELKARGKTVLVITHDDRYLAVADRCLRMEEGKTYPLTEEQRIAKGRGFGIYRHVTP